MPELPEVETIKNELAESVIGKRISDVTILWHGTVRQPSVEEFRAGLTGRTITGLERRGKYLIFRLSGGKVLLVHLKMTGALLVKPASEEPDKYVRAIIYLAPSPLTREGQGEGENRLLQHSHLDGQAVHFRDLRKFGKMWLVDDEQEVTGKLGPEPLEKSFTPELLRELLSARSAPVKALLSDQTIIAGIGNMYADEALFRAKIHPVRSGKSLTAGEIKRLCHAIKDVLERGIHNKGASVVNYFRPDGSQGSAHKEFRVAHRRAEPCPVCGTPIARIVVRQRGTYFCPKCQR